MNIQTLVLKNKVNGSEAIIYPTLLTINGRHYLIDCGYEETFTELVTALEKLGIAVTDLYALFISHDDIDHLGAVSLLKEQHPVLLVYCSDVEEASVSGIIKSERLQQAERSLEVLPPEHLPWARQFIQQLQQIKRIQPDGTFRDGEWIEEEVQVIATPGHTKGHVSFYIPVQQTVIACDAVVVENDALNIANPQFTLNLPKAVQSVALLKALKPEKLVCYHGGVVAEDVEKKLEKLIEQYK
ncbi:MAG TPA: MBL fold metallo-hydrolase [Lacibacter sp.]|nr:MBL fold metallo-hydrolase [Lacibacter sp.]